MAVLTSIREGIATNLRTLDGVTVLDRIPSEVTDPLTAFVEFAGAPDIRQSMGRGIVLLEYAVRVMVPDNGDPGDGEELLEEVLFTGATGIWGALESDKTLGGAAHDLVVDGYGPIEAVVLEGAQAKALLATVNLRVIAGGL